jgi:hypothetical protein
MCSITTCATTSFFPRLGSYGATVSARCNRDAKLRSIRRDMDYSPGLGQAGNGPLRSDPHNILSRASKEGMFVLSVLVHHQAANPLIESEHHYRLGQEKRCVCVLWFFEKKTCAPLPP